MDDTLQRVPNKDVHGFDLPTPEEGLAEAKDEAARIRWFFYILFVQSIVEIVNGEDEIWLLESGFKNKLHIWRVHNS